MGRAARLLLALGLMAAACGSGGDASDGGSTSEPTSTTTSTTTTSTTLATTNTNTESDPCAGEPFSIDERGVQLVPGCQYRTEEFVVPTTFEVTADSWLSFAEPDARVVYLGIDDDQDGAVDANIAIISYRAGTDEEPFNQILGMDGVDALSDPVDVLVGDRPAVTIDVLAVAGPTSSSSSGCTTTGVRFIGVGAVVVRLSSNVDPNEYGIPRCVTTRVWQLTVDDIPITIVAAALDDDRFEEFRPIVEDFLMNGVTFGDADG